MAKHYESNVRHPRRARRARTVRRRRRNPDTAVTVIGALLGLAVLGAVVYSVRAKRRTPALTAMAPGAAFAAPWYERRFWPWMWLRPRALAPAGASAGAMSGMRRRN